MSKWKKAILISSEFQTIDIKLLKFKPQIWKKHKAGQYYNLKIPNTSNNSYRSFTTISPPEEKETLDFAIQLFKNGLLSPKLFDLKMGDQIEIQGPLGEFYWDSKQTKSLLLIASGSGITPFISMLRHHLNNLDKRDITLLLSAHSEKDLPFLKEVKHISKMDKNVKVNFIFTKNTPKKRIDQKVLREIINGISDQKNLNVYIAGSITFVENIYLSLIKMNISSNKIYRERFGPNIYEQS